jgi:hypothetical protein
MNSRGEFMRRLLLQLLAVLVLVVPAFAQSAPQWKQFSEIVGHFSVLMPGDPGSPKIDVHDSGSRGNYSLRMYTLYSGKGDKTVLYAVGFLDYKTVFAVASPQGFLDGEVSSLLEDSKAKSEGVQKIQYRAPESFPGRELHFSASNFHIENYSFTTASMLDNLPPGVAEALGKPSAGSKSPPMVTARLFLANHRLYVLFCMAQPENLDPQAARRFLDSFQIYSPVLIP